MRTSAVAPTLIAALLAGSLLAGCGGAGPVSAAGDGAVPAGGLGASPAVPAVGPLNASDGDLAGDRVDAWDDVPAVSGLDTALLGALRRATAAAADDGIEVEVTSGWRSRAYQQHLLDEAVEKYGSVEEASRLVATPDTSAHVTGDAVDVGPTDAAYWMAQHGAEFGLCQVFANEVWHYELVGASDGTCPEMRADGAS